MKHLVIPDIHGRDKWRQPTLAFLDRETDGMVILLGDYLDSFDVEDRDMMDNFTDVIILKEKYPDRIILLLGNHCFPYISAFYSCSGNRKSIMGEAGILFRKNLHLFQIAYQVENTLFTHAGLSMGWLEYNSVAIEQAIGEGWSDHVLSNDYASLLNLLWYSGERQMLYQVSKTSGGSDWYDGPLWLRPRDLWAMMPKNLDQVVGHTQVNQLSTTYNALSSCTLTMTDCMGNADWEPLILEL